MSKIEILRDIHKNRGFNVFLDQTTRFFILNVNRRKPTQQTHTINLSLLLEKNMKSKERICALELEHSLEHTHVPRVRAHAY